MATCSVVASALTSGSRTRTAIENVRRAGEIALLLATQGVVVVVSLVSPHRSARDEVRRRHEERGIGFLEVHVAAPLEVCELRDPEVPLSPREGGHGRST